jgi:DNA-binding NtrC family response regulator
MKKKPHVLVIDDEPEIRDILRIMLDRGGFETTLSEDGDDALLKLSQRKFDIVVCDYLMPKMNGISLLKKVVANNDYTPFVFFSGNSDESKGLEMIGLGAYETLPKTQINKLVNVLIKTLKLDESLKNIDGNINEESDDFLKILHSTGF